MARSWLKSCDCESTDVGFHPSATSRGQPGNTAMAELFTPGHRLHYLKQYGSHCMAYSTLQPGMEYFDVPDVGYLAFMSRGRTRIVLADPICDPAARQEILSAFITENHKPLFVQISDSIARILVDMGFYATAMGSEINVDLQEYTTSGTRKQNLRTAINKARAHGIEICELEFDRVDIEQLKRISAEWIGEKANKRELRFLTRPAKYEQEDGVRKFYAVQGSNVIGFVFFNPIYDQRSVIGYVSDINRSGRDSPKNLDYAITQTAIHRFQQEGCRWLALGLLPLVVGEEVTCGCNALTKWCLRFVRSTGNRLYERVKGRQLYSFEGLAAHKAEYRGSPQTVFFASRSWFQLHEVWKVFKICNVF